MKIMSLLAFFLILIISSGCEVKEKEIIGSGQISIETRDFSNFKHITFNGSGNLYITQSDHELVEIEAESNILPLIKTEVIEGNLQISFNNGNFKATLPINIHVKVKNIQSIRLSGSGTITGQNLKSDRLKVSVSGSGSVDIGITSDKLISVLSGSGNFLVKGSVNSQEVWISGTGIYNGLELVSKESIVKISGSGQVFVNVANSLDAHISGAGVITYKGNPEVQQSISGSGKITKLK